MIQTFSGSFQLTHIFSGFLLPLKKTAKQKVLKHLNSFVVSPAGVNKVKNFANVPEIKTISILEVLLYTNR